MSFSRGIAVLGMHRNGTSLLTRGLQTLGVYLGDNFIDDQPDNPTGFWEHKPIVDLNERLLQVLGLKWESVSLIEDAQWQKPEVRTLHLEATEYLRAYFLNHPLWGFKDPRTIRLLPFWRSVFLTEGVNDNYVVIIRNPLSVASSLKERQGMGARTSHLLWLLYMVPYLSQVADRPFVVIDYDVLMVEPRPQLERIARPLKIALDEANAIAIEHFAVNFLDPNLRHNFFSRDDFDTIPRVSSLTREAYLWLHLLATDQIEPDSIHFWSTWESIRSAAMKVLPEFTGGFVKKCLNGIRRRRVR
jgi:hypothetical protein